MAYTYLIGWSKEDLWYYGVRYSKDATPSELFESYFTSSKYVHDAVEVLGSPDVVEIRKEFLCSEKARIWEHKVLRRLKVVTNKKFLNKTDNISICPVAADKGRRTKKPWCSNDPRRKIVSDAAKKSKSLEKFWNSVDDEEKKKIDAKRRGQKRSVNVKRKMRGQRMKMRGANHPNAKSVCLNGIDFDTIKEACEYYNISDNIVRSIIQGRNKGFFYNDVYYKSHKEFSKEHDVCVSESKRVSSGEISSPRRFVCVHCGSECKTEYLLNRWHNDNCKKREA